MGAQIGEGEKICGSLQSVAFNKTTEKMGTATEENGNCGKARSVHMNGREAIFGFPQCFGIINLIFESNTLEQIFKLVKIVRLICFE